MHQKLKRVLALVLVIFLLAMYAATFILSFQKNENAQMMFRVSLACTFMVPIFLYVIMLVAKALRPHKSPVVDAIIFDMGNVLLDFPWDTYARTLGYTGKKLEFLETRVLYNPEMWHKLDLNIVPYQDVMDEFAAMDPSMSDDIRKVADTVDTIIKPYPYTEEWLRELKRHGYKLYFLSNWCEVTYQRIKERGLLDFMRYMDGGIWSFDVHLAKPDHAIYNALKEKYHLNPSRCIFIDDGRTNVKAAQDCGFGAVRFTTFEETRKKLEKAGIVV